MKTDSCNLLFSGGAGCVVLLVQPGGSVAASY